MARPQRLAASVSRALRVILRIEWSTETRLNDFGCPDCGHFLEDNEGLHSESCELDAALTDAGLEDQASRDDARGRL